MRRLSPWARALLLATAAGLLVAAPMMYIAWQHNSQGEFHENGQIHWGAWLGVGATWFVLPFSLGAIIAAGLWFERKRG